MIVECEVNQNQLLYLLQREHVAELYRVCGRFAVNPELSFSWFDAANVIGKVRRYLQEATK